MPLYLQCGHSAGAYPRRYCALFVTANTARFSLRPSLGTATLRFAGSEETTMSFNYLTNSSGFTRISAYVGHLLDGAVDGHIEKRGGIQ